MTISTTTTSSVPRKTGDPPVDRGRLSSGGAKHVAPNLAFAPSGTGCDALPTGRTARASMRPWARAGTMRTRSGSLIGCCAGTRPRRATCRGGCPAWVRGRCWSARSCSSRRRCAACCRRTKHGWRGGRRRRTSRPSRPAKRCGCGASSATRAARCGCTRVPARSRALRRDRCPREVHLLETLPGIGAYTARAVASFAFAQRHPVVDTNVRRVVARAVAGQGQAGPPSTARDHAAVAVLLPDDAGGRGPVRRGADGTRRDGLHRSRAGLRAVPARRPVRLVRRRPAGLRRTTVAAPRIRRDRPAGCADCSWTSSVRRRARSTAIELAIDWPDPLQRDRALDSLVIDGLLVRAAGQASGCLPDRTTASAYGRSAGNPHPRHS